MGEFQVIEAKDQTMQNRADTPQKDNGLLNADNNDGTRRVVGKTRCLTAGCRVIIVSIFIFFIRLYQKFISPCLPPLCRFQPTCSAYAVDALKKHGCIKGIILTVLRLARCHPFCKGGFDPVPDEFRLRRRKTDNGTDIKK